MDLTGILAHGAAPDTMNAVLNRITTAPELLKSGGVHSGEGQAGDATGDLGADLTCLADNLFVVPAHDLADASPGAVAEQGRTCFQGTSPQPAEDCLKGA